MLSKNEPVPFQSCSSVSHCGFCGLYQFLGTGLTDKEDEEGESDTLDVVNLVIKALRTDKAEIAVWEA